MHTRLGLSSIRAVSGQESANDLPGNRQDSSSVEVRFWLPPAIAAWLDRNAGRDYKTRSQFLRDYFVAMYRAKGGKL